MKKKFLIIIFLFFLYDRGYSNTNSYAFINKDNLKTTNVFTKYYNQINYININDLTSTINLKYIWEPFTNSVEISDNLNLFKCRINSEIAVLNNNVIKLEHKLKMFNGGLYIPESLLVYFNNIIVSINNNTVFYSIIREPLDTAADKDDDITSVILKYSSINLPQVTKIKRGYKIRKIIIDPGHGGKDPGAVSYSGKVYEKNIVLNVAKVLKQYLEKILPNVSVMLTRETDEFLSLNQRSYIANKNNGDLFISLHCNSGFKNAQGYEIYYFSLTEDDETERTVRLFENSVYDKYEKSETKKLNTVDFIKTDLAQINHINESIDFAHYVENELSKKIIANNRGLRKARFYVLKDVFMPSVLIELGFLSNPKEEKLLNNKSYQNKICLGIAEAIKKYKNKVESIQYEIQN